MVSKKGMIYMEKNVYTGYGSYALFHTNCLQ